MNAFVVLRAANARYPFKSTTSRCILSIVYNTAGLKFWKGVSGAYVQACNLLGMQITVHFDESPVGLG